MARKLRVYAAQFDGVHEWVVAAPNQRAALDAFGVRQDLFAQGRAGVATDLEGIEAAQAEPGVPLRRLVGSNEPFRPPEEGDGGWAAALAAAPRDVAAGKTQAAPRLPKPKAGAKPAAGPAAKADLAARQPVSPVRPVRKAPPARRKAPDRRPLMKAEAELAAFAREEARALGEIARERMALDRREAKLRADLAKRREALKRAVERARRAYEAR